MDVAPPAPDTPVALDLEFVGTLTRKGGVTIPIEVRRILKVRPKEKVVFRVQGETVILETLPLSLADTFGAVKPINTPEDFSELGHRAREDQVEKIIAKMKS